MMFLVKDIQDLSQLESKTFSLNISNVNIKRLIYECTTILKSKAKEKKLELLIEWPENMLERMTTDENRVKQVLINLISNAIKYTQKGFVELSASMRGGQLAI